SHTGAARNPSRRPPDPDGGRGHTDAEGIRARARAGRIGPDEVACDRDVARRFDEDRSREAVEDESPDRAPGGTCARDEQPAAAAASTELDTARAAVDRHGIGDGGKRARELDERRSGSEGELDQIEAPAASEAAEVVGVVV